jgi:hypothetical protein
MKALGKAVIGGALFLGAFSAAGGARADTIVSWVKIVGIIQPGNAVGGITGGGEPWSTLGGHATVDLTNSLATFYVSGLVLAGGDAIGTTGPITSVKGTLVCNPSSATPTVIDTALVPLSAEGDATFIGSVSSKTASCSATSVAFLIRVKSGHWLANGAVLTSP